MTAAKGGVDEYLVASFERAFEREVVHEERVFNSLSFFVAAMALTVNVLGYIATKLPPAQLSAYSIATHALIVLAGLLVIGVMWSLFNGVRERVYRIPPKELDTLEWAKELRGYYFTAGLRGQALDDAVISDLRKEMLTELAHSIAHNRAQNASRTLARTQGISWMVAQLALAFSIVAIIFVHDQFAPTPAPASQAHGAPPANTAAASRASSGPQAEAASSAIPCRGLQDSRCQADRQGGPMTKDHSSATPAAPAPAAPQGQPPAAKPAAPPAQYFKKSDDSGGPLKK